MTIQRIKRKQLQKEMHRDHWYHGHMIIASWIRQTDKRLNGKIVESKGTLIRRRFILRRNWENPTPSGSFVPKGGIMFNVESEERARKIRARKSLILTLSLEGITHPWGEPDHPINVPLKYVKDIYDTFRKVMLQIED
jgi:hypothetical protein